MEQVWQRGLAGQPHKKSLSLEEELGLNDKVTAYRARIAEIIKNSSKKL